MLHKVAIHQTRLRLPGVGLDARGVCLGAKGLVLLPSLDRLVALLAIYTRELGLTDLLGSVKIRLVRSALGAREVALSFDVVTSELLDQVSGIGRLAGGFTFTGTTRHFVQYRDDSAPFGYDAPELLGGEGDLCLYHSTFSQRYFTEREIDLRHLVLRLGVGPEQARVRVQAASWVLAAPALGPPLARHLAQAGVGARVASVSLPSSPQDAHRREHWLFQLPRVPGRLAGVLRHTPGLELFHEQVPSACVQAGFAHPLSLAACPVFRERELVLFVAGTRPPYVIDELPVMADVEALVQPRSLELVATPISVGAHVSEPAGVPTRVRLLPTAFAAREASAMYLRGGEAEHLRKLAYLMSPEMLKSTRLAVTEQGVFVVQAPGTTTLPLGRLYAELGAGLHVPLGYQLAPRVDPSAVLRAMSVPAEHLVFVHADGGCHAIQSRAFTTLADALLEPQLWTEPEHAQFPVELEAAVPTLWLDPLGLLPLKHAKPVP